MNEANKKCSLCAEEIPFTVTGCPYCGARFKISSDGYCLACHEFRLADESGNCITCSNPVADWRVESTIIDESPLPPAVAPAEAPASAPARQAAKPGSKRRLFAILEGVLVLAGLGAVLWLWRDKLPTAVRLNPTSAAGAQYPQAPASIITITPTFTPAVTPTAPPTSTPRRTPTATPLPAWVADFTEPHLANIANRMPNFDDDFSDAPTSSYIWEHDPQITFNDGAMQVTASDGKIYATGKSGRSGSNDATNFILEFEVTPQEIALDGNLMIYFHYKDGGSQYNLVLNPDGVWEFVYSSPRGDDQITGGQTDQFGTGQRTKVVLIVYGDQMAFYLNGQPVGYGEDNRLLSEENGILVNAPHGTTSVEIDNVKFWNLNNLWPKSP